ncbi:Uncharacterised protein [Mycobacteroides abscessus subsp. abscessus]|nr:Uncharacterised protein [Mycobacteroides abscessus subsp. abscessus]SIK69323.1 Uncharacterised protein [Mycobacteroides abscessus subsp. abscessus]
MCSTRSGDAPGSSTSIVASRTVNALRSMIDAYPMPSAAEPAE